MGGWLSETGAYDYLRTRPAIATPLILVLFAVQSWVAARRVTEARAAHWLGSMPASATGRWLDALAYAAIWAAMPAVAVVIVVVRMSLPGIAAVLFLGAVAGTVLGSAPARTLRRRCHRYGDRGAERPPERPIRGVGDRVLLRWPPRVLGRWLDAPRLARALLVPLLLVPVGASGVTTLALIGVWLGPMLLVGSVLAARACAREGGDLLDAQPEPPWRWRRWVFAGCVVNAAFALTIAWAAMAALGLPPQRSVLLIGGLGLASLCAALIALAPRTMFGAAG
ncbi:MAG: hypothetical protein P8Y69_02700 [Gammaproteobacteria bacterium]